MRCRGVERKTCAGAASRENDTITNSAEDACSVVLDMTSHTRKLGGKGPDLSLSKMETLRSYVEKKEPTAVPTLWAGNAHMCIT